MSAPFRIRRPDTGVKAAALGPEEGLKFYLDQGFLIKNRRTTADRLEHASKSGQ